MKNLDILVKLAGYNSLVEAAKDSGELHTRLSEINRGKRAISKKFKLFLSEKLNVRESQIELFMSLTTDEIKKNTTKLLNNLQLNPQ